MPIGRRRHYRQQWSQPPPVSGFRLPTTPVGAICRQASEPTRARLSRSCGERATAKNSALSCHASAHFWCRLIDGGDKIGGMARFRKIMLALKPGDSQDFASKRVIAARARADDAEAGYGVASSTLPLATNSHAFARAANAVEPLPGRRASVGATLDFKDYLPRLALKAAVFLPDA